MPIDSAAADQLLTTTRAVRRRLDLTRPVPRNLLLECVRIAQQAPTGSNRQGWQWVIVEDAAKRAAIATLYREAAGTYFAEARSKADAEGQAQTVRVYDSAAHLADHLHEVPVHVFACIEGIPPTGSQAAFYASIYPAVWSFQLALRARGLGTVLTTLLIYRAKRIAELLGIPDTHTQCAMLPVAYTLGSGFKAAARPAPESIVHWDRW